MYAYTERGVSARELSASHLIFVHARGDLSHWANTSVSHAEMCLPTQGCTGSFMHPYEGCPIHSSHSWCRYIMSRWVYLGPLFYQEVSNCACAALAQYNAAQQLIVSAIRRLCTIADGRNVSARFCRVLPRHVHVGEGQIST